MAVRRPEEHPPDERIVGATGGPALHRDPAHDVAPGSGGAVAGGLTPVAIIAALLLVGILLAAWALTR